MWGFGGSSKSPAKDDSSTGLLNDWTSYSAPDREPDLEAQPRSAGANTSSQNASSGLDSDAMQKAVSAIGGFFTSTASQVSSGVAALPGALPTSESFKSVRSGR